MAQDREQDHTGCRKPQAPLLCTNNCGFFGCPTTMNLCSKCYRDLHLEEESQRAVKALGEKKEIMLLVDKPPIKGPVSVCATLQGDSTSVSPVQSSPELMLSKASASGRGASEPREGTVKTQQGAVTLTLPSPVASPQVQNPGSMQCLSCRKQVGLLGFRCRCGGVFCSGHRYSDRHCCTFDYKAAGRDAIAKANPVVRAEKVDKI